MNTTAAFKATSSLFRDRWVAFIHELQDRICKGLEAMDGKAVFAEDQWEREEGSGGGGKTRIITHGNVFEKGGVNTSVVFGQVSDQMRTQLEMDGHTWFACGLSLVIHPLNPYVPTVHANWRYFELYDEAGLLMDSWFGGGSDLTPFYLFEEDAKHFHQTLKTTLDPFGTTLYPAYKKQCDEYFVNQHRNKETRGIGGIFYDHLRPKTALMPNNCSCSSKPMGTLFCRHIFPLSGKEKTLHTEKRKPNGRK